MATKKKNGSRKKPHIEVKLVADADNSKERIYSAALKNGREKVTIGNIAAKSEAEARRKAKQQLRRDAC